MNNGSSDRHLIEPTEGAGDRHVTARCGERAAKFKASDGPAATPPAVDLKTMTHNVLHRLWQAIRRFPLPVLFIGLFAAHQVIGGDFDYGLPRALHLHLAFGLVGGFLWTLAAAIWAEAGGKSRWERFLGNFCGFVVLAILFGGAGILKTSPGLVLLTLVLVLSLAAHHRLENQNDAFWHYNQRLWIAALRSLMMALVLLTGIFLIAGSLEFLLSQRLPDGFYGKVLIVSIGVIAPMLWLTMIAKRHDGQQGEIGLGEEQNSRASSLGTGMLLRYLFVPLVLLYSLLLYRYAFTLLQGSPIPSGRLGPAVLAYALLGMATYVMSYPGRETGGGLIKFFRRSWFIIALVPTLLLGFAIYSRISAYGLTEARYLLAMVVVWLLFLSVAHVVWKVKDLRLIPASLAALAVLGSFGPPGAAALSIRSQMGELARLLKANALLSGGRVVAGAGKVVKLRLGDEARLKSILGFLNERGELARLAPWFEGHANDPFASSPKISALIGSGGLQQRAVRSADLAGAVAAALGVPKSPIGGLPSRRVVFYARAPTMLALKGAMRIAGPVNISLAPDGSREVATIAAGTGRDLSVVLAERRLVITDKRGRQAVFDLVEAGRRIPWFEDRRAVVPALTRPRKIAPVEGSSLNLRLLVTSLQGQRTVAGSYAFKQISFWVLLYKNNKPPPARKT